MTRWGQVSALGSSRKNGALEALRVWQPHEHATIKPSPTRGSKLNGSAASLCFNSRIFNAIFGYSAQNLHICARKVKKESATLDKEGSGWSRLAPCSIVFRPKNIARDN